MGVWPGYHYSKQIQSPQPGLGEKFGLRSPSVLARDLRLILKGIRAGNQFQTGITSAGLLRPDLAVPAYLGLVRNDHVAPIFNFFDRVGGGRGYSQRVTRRVATDWRGKQLSYDQHDGVDFVCPVGIPLVAAAPGRVAMIRQDWLRGGLTIAVDHGFGLITQYTHCSRALVELEQEVARGQILALSGTSGLDMTVFFPMVPPHIHFMVFFDGVPVDPYLAEGEQDHPGTWLHRNDPRPSGPLPGEAPARWSTWSSKGIAATAEACTNPKYRGEVEALLDRSHALVHLLEELKTHHSQAFPGGAPDLPLRPALTPKRLAQAREIKLTLPLPGEEYRGAMPADTILTR